MASPKTRRNTAIAAATCYLVSLPFLVLVLVGSIRPTAVLGNIYFLKLDVAHIIPIAAGNAQLLNSVARSLGLHDFYSVGLWGFCEGYLDEGITFCSAPKALYWFNPVEILVSELLAGARIALPTQAVTVLHLLRIGSHIMFGCFLAGAVANLVLLLLTPLALARASRLPSLCLLAPLAALSAAVLVVASAIATVIAIAAKIALTAQDQLNIHADVGDAMFAFMWIASLVSVLAFLLHAAMGCCCRPQHRPHYLGLPTEKTGRHSLGDRVALPKFLRRSDDIYSKS